MKPQIAQLLEERRIWRAGAAARGLKTLVAEQAALRSLLPGGGWPVGALVELLSRRPGCGALSLLLPVLRDLTAAGKSIAWIGAPYPPYAPSLSRHGLDPAQVWCVAEKSSTRRVWAAEQVLQSNSCGGLLLWLDSAPLHQLRRLQLAAGNSSVLTLLMRPVTVIKQPSPALLRLRVEPTPTGLALNRLKPPADDITTMLDLPKLESACLS